MQHQMSTKTLLRSKLSKDKIQVHQHMQCNNERQQNYLCQVITYNVTDSYNRLAYISLFLASQVQEILFTCLLGKVISIWVAQLVIQIKCGELTFILIGFACSLLTINEKKFKNISRQPSIQSSICPCLSRTALPSCLILEGLALPTSMYHQIL